MNHFLEGFIEGAKETPRGHFTPMIAIWRLLVTFTDPPLRSPAGNDRRRPVL